MVVDRREEVLPVAAPPHAPPAGEAAGAPVRQSSLWRDAYRRYVRNKGAVAAAVIFGIIVLYCLLIPGFWKIPGIWTSIFDIDPNDANFAETRLPPSLKHPFGTDDFGRDIFTRTALGGQISIGIGFVATLVILLIGVTYGAISGFVGGMLDNAMMRFLDALYGLPYLPFAIITIQIISNQGAVDFKTMVIALAIASWFITARIVRGQIITLKQNDYVRAAHAVGARWYRILVRHLLPNTLGVLIIAVFLELPGVVLGEAFLSFIGLGINPPDASWGSMAQEGRDAYRLHPLDIVIPSIAIATLVLCANFIADGLRDALDPRTRET
jgi:oligopeptide transport system permease protein